MDKISTIIIVIVILDYYIKTEIIFGNFIFKIHHDLVSPTHNDHKE